ncbi:MAG: hypothetical protein GXX09_06575 [Syntrophomonadaceae bacterium]|nr:hypothetical protein [Syntrophomonadaceae bacterium]
MHCPVCKHPVSAESPHCPNCGYPNRAREGKWTVLKTVYPPEDLLLKSMLESFGIPVRLQREAIGPVQGLTLGPLAEVKVLVLHHRLEEARQLLEALPGEP